VVGRLLDAGATGLQLGFVHHSLDHYLEQLAAMADLIRALDPPRVGSTS
jgi:hypothetical protein